MDLNEFIGVVDDVLYSNGARVEDVVLYSNGAEVGWEPTVPWDLIETTGEEDESLNANGAGVDWDLIPNEEGVDWDSIPNVAGVEWE